jgi:hypothetical protein
MVELYHRTNYWGQRIDAMPDRHGNVPFDVIWAMASTHDFEDGDCCRSFGRRIVQIVDADFEESHNGHWYVFKLSERRGNNPAHYFYNFALIPKGTYKHGKRSCLSRGWELEGEIDAGDALRDLEDVLHEYLTRSDNDYNHVHLAIMMTGGLWAGRG